MNTRLLCVLVALCAMSCAQAWPYMNPYVLSRMLGGLGWGEGGHASRGGFGGFGGGQGGFGNMGGFGGGEGGSHFGAGGGEGGSHFGAGGGEGGAAAAGGDDEAGAAGGEGGAAAGAEGGAPGGAEGAHQFPTAFPMGLGGYGYMGLNQFPGYGYNRMNPFLRTNPFYRFNPTTQPWLMGMMSRMLDVDAPSMGSLPDLGSLANEISERMSSLF